MASSQIILPIHELTLHHSENNDPCRYNTKEEEEDLLASSSMDHCSSYEVVVIGTVVDPGIQASLLEASKNRVILEDALTPIICILFRWLPSLT